MRSFSKGPNTLFEYRPGMDIRSLGGVHTRAGLATYLDGHGVLRTAAANELRDNHWINGKRYLLREDVATNLVIRAEEFDNAAWTKTQAGAGSVPVVTANNAISPDGTLNADKVVFAAPASGDFSFVNQSPTVVISTNYTFGFWVQAFAAGDVGKQLLFRHVAGSTYTIVTLTAAWQFVWAPELSASTAGNIQIGLRPVIGGGSAGTVTVNLFAAQLELGIVPSSYIKTTTAAASRVADVLQFTWAYAPQLMTSFIKAVQLGTPASNRVWELSGPGTPRHILYFPSALGTLYHENAAAVTATPAGSILFGNSFEFSGVLRADGSVLATKSINGAAETIGGPSAAQTLAGAWGTNGNPKLSIGHSGGATLHSNLAIELIRFVKGEQTFDYMQYDFLNAISSDNAEFVHLLQLEFESGTVRLATGAQDLSWNSVSWEAVGGLLEMGGIEETTDSKAQGIDIKLSGVDQTVLAILLGSKYRGRPVTIWRAHLDRTTGLVVGDPLLMFKGLQLSPYTVDEERDSGGGTVRISTRLSGYFGVERIRGIMSNLVSHQHYFSGDLFFQHTASLANVKIYWGTPVPRTPGNSGNTGGGGHGEGTDRL